MTFTDRQIGLMFVALGVGIAVLLPFFLVVMPQMGISEEMSRRPDALLPIVATKPWLFTVPGAVEMLAHALGAAAMLSLYLLWDSRSGLLLCATAGGLLWMGVDIVLNGVVLQVVPHLAAAHQAGDVTAAGQFTTVMTLVDAARLAGHFGGGLWVLGVSYGGRRIGRVGRALSIAGLIVGVAMAGNVFAAPLLALTFVTLPIWLVAFGIATSRPRPSPHLVPTATMS